jgi:hypothetical protein
MKWACRLFKERFIGNSQAQPGRPIPYVQAAVLAEKLFKRRHFVRGRLVEQDDDRAAHMSEQLTQ